MGNNASDSDHSSYSGDSKSNTSKSSNECKSCKAADITYDKVKDKPVNSYGGKCANSVGYAIDKSLDKAPSDSNKYHTGINSAKDVGPY